MLNDGISDFEIFVIFRVRGTIFVRDIEESFISEIFIHNYSMNRI